MLYVRKVRKGKYHLPVIQKSIMTDAETTTVLNNANGVSRTEAFLQRLAYPITIAFPTSLIILLALCEALQLRRHSSVPRKDQRTTLVGRRTNATADNASESARLSSPWSSRRFEAPELSPESFLSSEKFGEESLFKSLLDRFVIHLDVSSVSGSGQ
jgi:hypothetical protein